MGNYNPPYEITDKIVMLVASIAEKSGRIMEYYRVGMSGTTGKEEFVQSTLL